MVGDGKLAAESLAWLQIQISHTKVNGDCRQLKWIRVKPP